MDPFSVAVGLLSGTLQCAPLTQRGMAVSLHRDIYIYVYISVCGSHVSCDDVMVCSTIHHLWVLSAGPFAAAINPFTSVSLPQLFFERLKTIQPISVSCDGINKSNQNQHKMQVYRVNYFRSSDGNGFHIKVVPTDATSLFHYLQLKWRGAL